MVHNGIEYGLMAAYAEGLNVLAKANIGAEDHVDDAETAPLPHPEYYRFDLDLAAITEVWRRGSVVSSWLLDLTAEALAADPQLDGFAGNVVGLGRGTLDDQRGDRRRVCPSRCWRRRCSSGSARGAAPTSPTRCCRRCAPASADTSRRKETDCDERRRTQADG